MADEPLHSIGSGSFDLMGIQMRCHVLSNGQRVIDEDSVTAFFDMLGGDQSLDTQDAAISEFAKWIRGKGVPE